MANPSGQCIEEGNKINGLLKERASAENAASRKPQRNLINSGQLTFCSMIWVILYIKNNMSDNATLSDIIICGQAVRLIVK